MSPEYGNKVAEGTCGKDEAYFRTLLQHVLDVVAVLDADGTLRYVSPAVEAMLGYAPEQVTGTAVRRKTYGLIPLLTASGTNRRNR